MSSLTRLQQMIEALCPGLPRLYRCVTGPGAWPTNHARFTLWPLWGSVDGVQQRFRDVFYTSGFSSSQAVFWFSGFHAFPHSCTCISLVFPLVGISLLGYFVFCFGRQTAVGLLATLREGWLIRDWPVSAEMWVLRNSDPTPHSATLGGTWALPHGDPWGSMGIANCFRFTDSSVFGSRDWRANEVGV